jgi:hypothetical protein
MGEFRKSSGWITTLPLHRLAGGVKDGENDDDLLLVQIEDGIRKTPDQSLANLTVGNISG